jgi:uncharacterized hydrophobic protein (TIGR00271 family)
MSFRPLRNIVADFKLGRADLRRIQEDLFFDGPNARQSLERFAILMFFATLIASYGVIADSTATVIGAMLIAPLMTPVLAVAAAVVTGDMRRAGYSMMVVIGGVFGAIALGWWIGFTFRSGTIDVTTNSQILSRVSPRLVDLYAALGAGAVGAFATSRKDIANTLPGAAIAIALVPPLAVVGLTLSQGAYGDATGALLLFLTNFFAILIAGSLVLSVLGLSKVATKELQGAARTQAFVVIVIGTLLVAIPLAVASFSAVRAERTLNLVTTAVQDTLKGSGYDMVSTRLQPDGIYVEVKGEGNPPSHDKLSDAIHALTSNEVAVHVEAVPIHRTEILVNAPQAQASD